MDVLYLYCPSVNLLSRFRVPCGYHCHCTMAELASDDEDAQSLLALSSVSMLFIQLISMLPCYYTITQSWPIISHFSHHTFPDPGVHRGAGAVLFLTTGWCTKMVGTASALSLVLPFLVLTNWSASTRACRGTWVYFPHTATRACLHTGISNRGWMHSIREHLINTGHVMSVSWEFAIQAYRCLTIFSLSLSLCKCSVRIYYLTFCCCCNL